MTSEIEKKISSIVEYQFPQFYREEGQTFIQFVKAYYEWMEETDNVNYLSRRIYDNRDIDKTIEEFLYYFQKQYLYGIPFDVIINKRYLLKHVLDVYRSKGSIQCYKLLFRLIYNQDIDIYLPGKDMLRVSDGKWKEPRYLEVSDAARIPSYVGKTIVGASSGTKAIVESLVKETVSNSIVCVLYISNINPKTAQFQQGEKILLEGEDQVDNLAELITISPTVLGSFDYLEIVNGGSDFQVGDILKVVKIDPVSGLNVSYGKEGLFRVANTARGRGSISFTIINSGSGYLVNNTLDFEYNNASDTTGVGAAFDVINWSDIDSTTYNTDVLAPYLDLAINATSYGFPASPTANSANTIAASLTFVSNNFGSILTLGNITTGNSYTQPMDVFIRSVLSTNNMPGTVSYTTSSSNVTGTSTEFTRYFANNDVITIQANSSLSNTVEQHVIKNVVNNTVITLYGKPVRNSTASAGYRINPSIYSSNFAVYESIMQTDDGSIPGLNANVFASPIAGNGVISTATAINSGLGYTDSELIIAYLYGGLNNLTIVNGGTGYTNNDTLVFSGGNPIRLATGYVTTNSTGGITATTLTYAGSGYDAAPTITVKTNTGSNAVITTTVKEFNTSYQVQGRIKKAGIGRSRGRWITTDSFLNADKYIQDSYYYQDFSYEIGVATVLSKYKEILYNTFHIAGAELFGKFLLITIESSPVSIAYEQTEATIS